MLDRNDQSTQPIDTLNAVQSIWRYADEGPDHVAVREDHRGWSFAELRALIAQFAHHLQDAGVKRCDRVLLVAPTSPGFIVAYHGILAVGAVAVTVNAMSTQREIEYFLEDAECSLVVAWEAGQATAAARSRQVSVLMLDGTQQRSSDDSCSFELVATEPHDVAVLLYTSGTTGKPKGAELTHANIVACVNAFRHTFQISPNDRVGTALPLFHVFGQIVVMGTAFSAGASLSILEKFNAPALLEIVAQHRLTVVAGVPTMWNAMLHAKVATRDLDTNLRLAISGGAALPVPIKEAFRDKFGCTILGGYGLTETTGAATFEAPIGYQKEGSVGTALPGIDISIRGTDGQSVPCGDIGEVAIRGPVVMRGYWREPSRRAAPIREEWFLSGDMGRVDEDGYLWIVDRKKDMIIRGGYNIYPREVEEVLYEYPNVLEAAVVGVPDTYFGEETCAVLVSARGSTIDIDELGNWLLDRLSRYKVPRLYRLVDELPIGPTGKIAKRDIDVEDLLAFGHRIRLNRSER